MYRVATLIVDLDDVPKSSLMPGISPSGQKYLTIDAQVHISMQSVLEFYVTVEGKKYGALTAKFE